MIAVILCGCGTVGSRLLPLRAESTAEPIGWPVFYAVYADWDLITGASLDCKTAGLWPILFPFCVASFPVDIVLDCVLLPADVAAGYAGWSKKSDSSGSGCRVSAPPIDESSPPAPKAAP